MDMTSKGQVTNTRPNLVRPAIRDQFGMDSTTDIEFAVRDRFERVRGSADSCMTTEQILRLTRGEDD